MQTGLPRRLRAEESRLSGSPPETWRMVLFGEVVALFIFLIPRALAITIHLYALGVQAIDWLCCSYIRKR